MTPQGALLVGVIAILVVLIIAAYGWYNYTGWKPFSFVGTVPYVPGPPCSKPSDCAKNQTCVGGTCMTTCGSDSDCKPGTECVGGYCQPSSIPSWKADGASVASLRFKDCVFTVVDPRGNKYTQDVTAVLNGMAVAYRGSEYQPPVTLYLDRPLNAFSFLIDGVNDSSSVPTQADAAEWATSASTLTGKVRTI